MFFLLVFFLGLSSANNAYSQDIRPYDLEMQAKHAEEKGYDPSYRVNYFENIILRSTFSSNIYNLQFVNGATGNAIDLRPANENLIGFSVDYKWIALGVSFAPGFISSVSDQELKDLSETIQLNLNFFYSDQWRQELSYTYNKGFFVDTNFELQLEEIERFRNTELFALQGATYYIANKNFSFRAHYAQTERQLRSAGSLIPRLNYVYSIIRPSLDNITIDVTTAQLDSFDLIGSLGYLYTFVYNRKWLATVGVHPGIGYNHSHYTFNNNSQAFFNSASFTFKSEITLGYNSYRWFFGINGFWQNFNNSNIQDNEINSDRAFILLYLGYRFNDNKPMRKFFGWFEEKFGF
jgi:hypothetical protein